MNRRSFFSGAAGAIASVIAAPLPLARAGAPLPSGGSVAIMGGRIRTGHALAGSIGRLGVSRVTKAADYVEFTGDALDEVIVDCQFGERVQIAEPKLRDVDAIVRDIVREEVSKP